MSKTLLITSSPRGDQSHSTKIATELAESLGTDIVRRDLNQLPLLSIDADYLGAIFTPAADRTDAQRESLKLADTLIAEVQAADTLIIAAAMINFGMPSNLKIWIDLITRVGTTVNYGPNGPEGTLGAKRAILVLASGGLYQTGPQAAMNHLEPALRTNLAFLGISNPEVIRIEGTLHGDEAIERAINSAREEISHLVAA